MAELVAKGKVAKEAAARLIEVMPVMDDALVKMAAALEANAGFILAENARDMENAKRAGMAAQMQDRLLLTADRIGQVAEGIRQVAALESPLGRVLHRAERPNGLKIEKISVPLGVIGIIYESRPNVTADAAALCLKAGNAVILRGGKEAILSNIAIVKVLAEAAQAAGLPAGCIQLIEDITRESAVGLMKLNEYLDVIIPRGGAGLIKSVMENATVPAIETGTGNCHIYVDASANIEMAQEIAINAKTSRPSVCNAAEKLLVHQAVAREFLPGALAALAEKGVEIRGCEKVREIYPAALPMASDEWYLEYLDMVIGVKVVNCLACAIAHVNKYSSKHSEAIITSDTAAAEKFLAHIDSSSVYVNASTRFTDGFEFGLGAEIGISTQKVHARGPMGLMELTSTKYQIRGEGQIR
ncbi:MAG: glutamate-5-semialdehyde dehydrogenase [Defluviitaleaceae bacterium]|nr:glutamate-5-semialdehyde dehydrogenase [Defluviitaleaceae bacterium]